MAGKAGASGRPPKPIEQKRMLGITRSDRVPDPRSTVAIESAEGAPVPVVLQAVGREMWDELTSARWVARLDLRLVEAYCKLADEIVEMEQEIENDGLILEEPMITPAGVIVTDQNGERVHKKVTHPLLKEKRVAQKLQLELATALGFSPISRSRLGVAEIKAASKLAELKQRIEQSASSNQGVAAALANQASR